MTLPAEVAAAAERGWRLLPCASRSKVPLFKSWPSLASSDVAVIERWSARYPTCNWGVALGERSGAFVVDIDGEQGLQALCELEQAHKPLPATLACLTARGRHLWFTYPAQASIRCSTGKLGPQLDTRAEGGHVLIPPSVHPSGAAYRWEDPRQAIAPVPEWLVDHLTAKPVKTQLSPRSPILCEGQRNDGLTRYAGALRRQGADRNEIEAALLEANERRCRPPLPGSEVATIAKSAAGFAVGGPDILQNAWQAIEGQDYPDYRQAFRGFCEALQRLRLGEAVALPVERIAGLLGCHWSTVAIYRREGVAAGWLRMREGAIKHALAATFEVLLTSGESSQILTISSNQNQARGGGEMGATENGIGSASEKREPASEKQDASEKSIDAASDKESAAFHQWRSERCISRKSHDDSGGVGALHRDFTRWCCGRGVTPTSRLVFEELLAAAGFAPQAGLAKGLLLREDLHFGSGIREDAVRLGVLPLDTRIFSVRRQ